MFLIITAFIIKPFGNNNDFKIPKAKAGALTNLSVSVADKTKSASTTYTVSFTNATKIPKDSGRIIVQFQGPYYYDYNFYSATVATGSSPSTLSVYSRSWNGLLLSTSSDIAANTAITLKMSNITNPSRGGYYFVHVSTSDYSTNLDGASDWGADYNSGFFEIGSNTNVIGTITAADGSAVAFAGVSIYNSNWSQYYTAYTDKNGKYGIGDVAADTYNFDIYGYNTGRVYFPPNKTTITVGSSGVTTKNASFLAATKTLKGKVTKNTSTSAAVTDAYVSVSKIGGNGWANVLTDSSGNYTMSLIGGTWSIYIYPKTWPSDWTYSTYNETVSFADDSSTETLTKNFAVESLSATINGSIQKPDGSTPTQNSVGLSFSNTKSQWFSAQMNTDGTFTVKTTPSTYSINGWVSDNSLSFPVVDNFTVGDNETKNLGVIKMIEKKDVISGTIKDNTGTGVPNASVSAWKNEGGWDWSSATSDSNGNYTLKVTPGSWQVSAWPQWKEGGSDYVYTGKSINTTVKSGVASTVNFTFLKATAIINGTVTDPDGNVLSTLNSWANANDGSGDYSNIGASVTNGIFRLKIPAGTWDINVYIYSSDFGTSDPVKVTIGDNETKSVTIKTVKNDAVIKGTVYDDKGNKITNKWISIYATKGKYGTWQSASLDQVSGTYSIKVSAGTWNLGWWIDQNLGYSSGSGNDIELAVKAGETKTYDINLKKADSTISGKATKSDGSAMPWAWITADTRDPNEKKSADTFYYSNGASSNNNGDYTLKLPAGTYWVGANMWPGSGFINPIRQKVTIDADHPVTVNLTFRKADASIGGTVTKDGALTNAFVTAWSEDGGYAEANSNNAGTYGLSVSSGTKWHLTAIKQIDKEVWKSKETIVDMTNTKDAAQDLVLLKQNYDLPKSQTITFDPSKQQTITLEDGTTITAPAGSITTQSGNVTLSATPDANLASEEDAKPIAYGYDLSVQDSTGKEISTFKSNVTVEAKYQDSWVSDSKVTDENELIMGYYDTAAGTWRELDSCTVNEDNNTVTCQVNHFTKFALVFASDTTPPAAPTDQKATPGSEKVTLSWTNPKDADFKGVNIYRSTEQNKLGDKVHSLVSGTSQENTGLSNGTTYYYTLKAVDVSGNESINTAQVSVTPGTLPKTGTPSQPLGPVASVWLILPLLILLFGLSWRLKFQR